MLAREFKNAGCKVEFVLLKKHGELLQEVSAEFEVVSLNCPRLRYAPLALKLYLERRKPDVLLVALWPLTGIANLAILLSGGFTKLIVSEHNDFRKMPSISKSERYALKYFGRLFYSQAFSIVAVSEGVSKSLQEVAGLSPEKISVINNPLRGLRSALVSTDTDLPISDWANGELRLIAIGSLKPQKGFDILLHVVAHLSRYYDVRLAILGEGELRRDLEELSFKLGLENRVYLPGFSSDTLSWLKHADVFVLSSRWEGFGNVLIEALSVGVPVVSTDCPSGPAEILDNGRYGKLVAVDNIDAMVKAVEDTYSNPPETYILKMRANDFRPSLAAGKYLNIFRAAVDE